MDCKIRVMYQIYIIPFAFFGVLRTFFAKKVLSRRRQLSKSVILGGVYGQNYTFGTAAALDGPIPAQ